MVTQSPFSWLSDAADKLRANFPADLPKALMPPPWVTQELQHRLVLFLNHVLMQEPAARERLQRQRGRCVQLHWRDQVFECQFTPAGLLDLAPAEQRIKAPDLVLRLSESSPFALARSVLQGNKPAIRIEGDVQLAAEVNWLIDHVRWDPEEDLARLIGDAPAHTLAQMGHRVVHALRDFVQQKATPKAPS